MLAVKMENCPICNEPVEGLKLRSDHFPAGAPVQPLCRGGEPRYETVVIELERRYAEATEAATATK